MQRIPLNEVLEEHESERGALIPVLQAAQDIYGYLPREVLETIAQKMSMAMSGGFGDLLKMMAKS